jgi:flagellar M-ring protein FliF
VSNAAKKSVLPAPVAAAVSRTSTWFGALAKSTRILLISTAAFAAIFVPYAVLFGQLEQDDAGAIVAKLKELNAPYRLGVGGSTIEVPESRVGELRLELASSGMPRGGGVGFESFDKMKLGATEFEQRVLYRRALEGELSRTIGTLAAVQSARVHLVLPEKSVFVARTEPASASIVLRLRSGRALGPSEVSGIVHLTAASVAGLAADRVALLTTDGEMLRKPRDASDGTAQASDEDRGSRQHAIEVELEERARLMLEKVVGPGHVDVRVTAELDPARVERVEDHFDPGKTVLRSEETSIERTGGGLDDTVAGVPGAESNLPTGAAPAAALLPPTIAAKGDAGAPKALASAAKTIGEQPFRESHTRNYEVDHVSEKRVLEPGTLKRVAVAVVIDGITRTENGQTSVSVRDRAELQKLEALVRSAVGANDARGDVVTLDCVPFDDEKGTAEAPPPATFQGPTKVWRTYLPAAIAAAALIVLAIVVGVARRRPRPAFEATPVLTAAISSSPPQLGTTKPVIDVRAAAIERAAADPATAALVLRAWLGTSAEVETKTMVARS